MTLALQSASWASIDELKTRLGSNAPQDAAGEITLQDCIDQAAELLYSLSGRQFPGSISSTVRPTSRPEQCPDNMFNRILLGGGYGFGWNAAYRWG
ncbi:MAG TPA: hypothetical protein VH593_09470, partial [Ktedonobacteraceae bacterium]